MKLLNYMRATKARYGLALSDTVGLDLLACQPSLPESLHGLLPGLDPIHAIFAEHQQRADELESRWAAGETPTLPYFDLRQAQLLAPVILPSKIIAVGLNYRDHAAEQNKPLPARPLLFAKAPSCLQAPGLPIQLPEDLTRVDAEAELAVVIGKPGRAIDRAHAIDHIAGFTCMNDVSDREAQYTDKQFFRGKSIDTGGPCGPWLVTPDELPPLAHGLAITCHWNDQLMQESNTDQLIFPIDELISYISRNMTLLPGDIITTGTPGGVGVFREPPVFLKPGDKITVTIEGIGSLSNPVTRWPG